MTDWTFHTETLVSLAVALGCGMLMGIERERRKGRGPGRALAGVRSFTLTCLSGALCLIVGQLWMALVGAVFIGALCVVASARTNLDDPGVTTEIALMLSFLIGVLSVQNPPLAAGVAVGVTALLAARETLHHFSRHWLSDAEIHDGLLLAALVLVALPLVPDRPLWGVVLNPHVTLQLLALLLAIQALAHLSQRLLRSHEALALSALASGFVSSTATIATHGLAVRDGAPARTRAGAGLLSCVATLLQLLVVAAAVQPGWLAPLAWPTLAGASVAAVWGLWLLRKDPHAAAEPPATQAAAVHDRMFSLRGAALVAAVLTGVQAGVQALRLWLGEAGLLAGTLVASLLELHAAMAAVLAQAGVPPGAPGSLTALVLGLSVHALSKSVNAWLTGGRWYAMYLVPGLLVHTALSVGLLLVSVG